MHRFLAQQRIHNAWDDDEAFPAISGWREPPSLMEKPFNDLNVMRLCEIDWKVISAGDDSLRFDSSTFSMARHTCKLHRLTAGYEGTREDGLTKIQS